MHEPNARQIGGFPSLIAALAHAREFDQRGLRFFDGLGKTSVFLSYRDLWLRSTALAAQWQTMESLPQGSRIGLLAETGADFIVHFCACQMAALVPCPLPLPGTLQGQNRYEQTLDAMAHAAGISLIAGPQKLLSVLHLEDPSITPWFYESAPPASADDSGVWPALKARDIAYVQFSSGSTAEPKGIAISHGALMANVDDILNNGMKLQESDRAFSWLPFYHDMGLVGMLLAPLCAQVNVDYLAPSSFVRRPHLWPQLMAREGSHITYAPPFAYQLAAERAQPSELPNSLAALRIAGVGGDRIDIAQLQVFAERYAGCDFNPDAFKPSYGLAEATLAVSMCNTPFADLARSFVIDEARGMATPANADQPSGDQRQLVSCGHALPGWEMSVCDAQNMPLPPMHIGKIFVRGAAQMSGFMQGSQLQALPTDGVDTGDTGFMQADGELFIVGRDKDLLIVRGRNLWPQDVERVAAQELQCDADDLMLLQSDDLAAPLFLLAHTRLTSRIHEDNLSAALVQTFGLAVQLHLVPNGFIERTSSGKKARGNTRSKFLHTIDLSAAQATERKTDN